MATSVMMGTSNDSLPSYDEMLRYCGLNEFSSAKATTGEALKRVGPSHTLDTATLILLEEVRTACAGWGRGGGLFGGHLG